MMGLELLAETPPEVALLLGFSMALAVRRTVVEGVVATQIARLGLISAENAEKSRSEADLGENGPKVGKFQRKSEYFPDYDENRDN